MGASRLLSRHGLPHLGRYYQKNNNKRSNQKHGNLLKQTFQPIKTGDTVEVPTPKDKLLNSSHNYVTCIPTDLHITITT